MATKVTIAAMRFTVSPEQLKFFHLNGFLEVAPLLTPEDTKLLLAKISSVRKNTPGYPDENLHRSIPFISELAKKRGWGKLVSELIHKKTIRIKSDVFYEEAPPTLPQPDEDCCGLLIALHSGKGLFFKHNQVQKEFHSAPRGHYLLLILTPYYLPTPPHPIIAA